MIQIILIIVISLVQGQDICLSQPCQNDSECLGLGQTEYFCFCNPGYTGQHCELFESDPCETLFPCENDSICTSTSPTEFSCECLPGFMGTTCSIDIDECAQQPCLNGASCVDGIDTFRCECLPGFAGYLCEEALDPCSSDPCLNGAACARLGNSVMFECVCFPGYTGELCENQVTTTVTTVAINTSTISDDLGINMNGGLFYLLSIAEVRYGLAAVGVLILAGIIKLSCCSEKRAAQNSQVTPFQPNVEIL